MLSLWIKGGKFSKQVAFNVFNVSFILLICLLSPGLLSYCSNTQLNITGAKVSISSTLRCLWCLLYFTWVCSHSVWQPGNREEMNAHVIIFSHTSPTPQCCYSSGFQKKVSEEKTIITKAPCDACLCMGWKYFVCDIVCLIVSGRAPLRLKMHTRDTLCASRPL